MNAHPIFQPILDSIAPKPARIHREAHGRDFRDDAYGKGKRFVTLAQGVNEYADGPERYVLTITEASSDQPDFEDLVKRILTGLNAKPKPKFPAPDLRSTLQEIVDLSGDYFVAETIGGRAEMVEDINILARRLLSHIQQWQP